MTDEEEELLEELIKNKFNPLRTTLMPVSAVELLALHGMLCLALRHPGIPERVRIVSMAILVKIEQELVDMGAATPEQVLRIRNLEHH